MAVANTSLRVSELDFGSIKENLKNYLRNQAEFQDFDFEGSGMSVLLDILAYNTHYMGYYLNMVANEMFLDTAQLRNSVLSHAKALGYVPTSRQGAQAKISILVTPSNVEDDVTNVLTLDKYTKFFGADINGINHNFVAVNSNTVSKVGGTFTFSNVFVKQGEVVTQQYLMESTNTSRRFKIPSANVDLSTVQITVQESASNTYTTEYIRAEDITEVRSNSAVYFIEEDEEQKYTFYFGDDFVGQKPKNGNIIICTYLDTVGTAANNISVFTAKDQIGGLYRDNVRITTTLASYSGTEKESIEEIRFRSPIAYTVQNRAVIPTDYELLLIKDYNNIEAVSVWGGEDNDPIVYGKVFISIKPKGNYYLSNLDKERIKTELIKSRNVVTITPEIVDPDYVYLSIRVSVNYNSSKTNRTAPQIEALVRQAISDYKDRELNRFDSIFRKSKLQYYIENCEPSITGSDLKVYVQKRLTLVPNETRNYNFEFNMQLKKGDYVDKLYSIPQIIVKDLENADKDVYFEEIPNSFNGVDYINIINPGRNYLTRPTVTITGDGTGATAMAEIVNGKVDRIVMLTNGSNYTRATVTITGGDGREATAIVQLQANKGLLRSYYFKDNGEKVIVNQNAGTVNYETGLVQLTTLNALEVIANDFYNENVLTINTLSGKENIYPLRNRILTLDENDVTAVQIFMVAES